MNNYINIRVKQYTDLDFVVSEMMGRGYEPIGSPYLGPDNQLTQAMIYVKKTNRQVLDDAEDAIKSAHRKSKKSKEKNDE